MGSVATAAKERGEDMPAVSDAASTPKGAIEVRHTHGCQAGTNQVRMHCCCPMQQPVTAASAC